MDGYDGQCSAEFETLKIDYTTGWSLELNYTLKQNAYFELNSLNFKYVVDEAIFPNVADSEKGPKSALLENQTLFSANKGNSYKCFSESMVNINENIELEITKYQAQPFLSDKNTGFDTGFFFKFILSLSHIKNI